MNNENNSEIRPINRCEWQPIETAPKNGEQRIMITRIVDGEITDIDFDATFEQDQESWEIPQFYWVWKSAFGRVEDPTHWAPLPCIDSAVMVVDP